MIAEEQCKGCELCIEACPTHALVMTEGLNRHGYHPAHYLGKGCTGCGICFYACPEPGAITVFKWEGSLLVETVDTGAGVLQAV